MKQCKRLISLVLVTAMLLAALPQLSLAVHASNVGGECGDALHWSFDTDTAVLTVTGSGAMWDFEWDGGPWHEYCYDILAVQLPNGLTQIGDYAFCDLCSLKDVVIPNGVRSIGAHAFAWCYELQSVTIPGSVERIGDSAFTACESLKSVTIPQSVTEIGMDVFFGAWLEEILVSASNPAYCSVDGVLFSKDKTVLVQYPCRRAGAYTVPQGVTRIGESAFCLSAVTSLTLPASVTELGYAALDSYELTEIIVSASNPEFCSVDGVLFGKDRTELLRFPGGKGGAYAIPNTVSYIGDSAFYCCDLLTDVTIPESVSSIDSFAFAGCGSLKEVTVPQSVESIGMHAFSSGVLKRVTILNPQCEIEQMEYTLGNPEQTLIYGQTNSTAQSYAKQFGYRFMPVGGFTDVPANAYYAEAVDWALEQGVTEGTGVGVFSPNNNCTRAQVVTFLWRAEGKPYSQLSQTGFTDVKENSYYSEAVSWAVETGVTTGTGVGTFSPNGSCTRGQVVTFLWRAAGEPEPAQSVNPFTDVNKNAFYYKAVLWAVGCGITKGTTADKFSPDDVCTRGQVVTFLYRAQQVENAPIGAAEVGISMPTKDLQRWNQDGRNLAKLLRQAGHTVNLMFANNDPQKQAQQIAEMLEAGAKVLIVSATVDEALTDVLAQAKQAGCKIISYDRPLWNTDAVSCHATFDNYEVGVLQGKFIENALNLPAGGSYNIELIAGDYDDSNARVFYDGAMSVLQKYLDNGVLNCRSGQVSFADVTTEYWSAERAERRFKTLLSTFYADKQLDAVLCSNDSTAQGVVSALESCYSNSVYPVVTGQDCDIVSAMFIMDGLQAMSVFKRTLDLASMTAEIASAFLEGRTPSADKVGEFDNGVVVVPSYLCSPQVCTKDNIRELLIDSGYYTEADLRH